jgi:hypothetical protein
LVSTKTADSGVPESALDLAKEAPSLSSRVRVRNSDTGTILPHKVPRVWLDGRFPNLKEVPSSKAGK